MAASYQGANVDKGRNTGILGRVAGTQDRQPTEWLNIPPGGIALDVGCGPGTNAPRFAGADYVGVDVNEGYLAIARAKYPGRFIQADLQTAELSSLGTFDTILVNANDTGLRLNRLKLLEEIRAATRAVADFSKIEG